MAESSEQQNPAGAGWAESDLHIAFGQAIRVRRTIRGLSQEALAFNAGLHRNYLGAVERAEVNPTLHSISRITRGLDVPLADLLAETDEHLADPEALARLRETRLKRRRRRLTRATSPTAPSGQAASASDHSQAG